MKWKDATSSFGSVGFLLSALLIFLIYADAAYACPGHSSRVVYRTTNSRTMPGMRTTVITYGGPVSVAPCGETAYSSRRVKYVTARADGYYGAPQYVRVRSKNAYYPAVRTGYVAVRSVDVDDAPRYVAVRRRPVYVDSGASYVVVRRQPAYVDSGSRYVVVRNGAPRTRYVAVRDVDLDDMVYDDAPSYTAVRRYKGYDAGARYVPTRYVDSDDYVAPTRYVAVRSANAGCACDVSSLVEAENIRPRHVVVKTDYLEGTSEVVYRGSSYGDTAYVSVPNRTYVAYTDADPYWHDNSVVVMPASYIDTRTVTYRPIYDDSEISDQAILDTGGATLVAADDIEDACLSRVARRASPAVTRTRGVTIVPQDDVNYDAYMMGDTTYVLADDSARAINYVPVVDSDATYVVANDDDSCSCPVAMGNFDDDVRSEAVSYVRVNEPQVIPVHTLSYEAVEPASDEPVVTVDHVVDNDLDVGTVSVVPAENIGYVDTADTEACECPTSENIVLTEPDAVADTSTFIVKDANSDVDAEVIAPDTIAADNGYRDGFDDGQDAALSNYEYRPGNSDDFQEANNGYDAALGDHGVYADRYRDSFLRGYSAGFSSVGYVP